MAVNDDVSEKMADDAAQGDPRSLEEVAFVAPDFYDEPYRVACQVYARLRREAPVWWCEALSAWVITRYEDVRSVLKDPDTFGQVRPPYGPYSDPKAGSFFLKDPPDHGRVRRIFTSGGSFSAKSMDSYKDAMQSISSDLVQRLPAGEVDALADVAVPAAAEFFLHFFDLREYETEPDEARWQDSIAIFFYPGTGAEKMAGIVRYFKRVMEIRRRDPGRDPLSLALLANDQKVADERLTDEQMAWNFHDLVLAGAASLSIGVAESLAALAQHAESQRSCYWSSPEAIDNSVNELMRWTSRNHWVLRRAKRDVEVGSRLIRSGDMVFPVIASACRDETVFERGDDLDLGRQFKQTNLAFGYGPHITPGIMLAKAFLATILPIFVRARRPFGLAREVQRKLFHGQIASLTLPLAPNSRGAAA